MSESLDQLAKLEAQEVVVTTPRKRTRTVAAVEPQVVEVEPMATSLKTGDKAGKAVNVNVAGLVFGYSTEADLKDATKPINKHHLSGKRKGVAVAHVVSGATVVSVAFDEAPTKNWVNSGAVADYVPAGAQPAQGTLGDGRRRQSRFAVPMTEFPVVTDADLKSGNASINQRELSGKKLGSMVVNASTGFIYVAVGSAPTAKWICMDSTSADITPTAATPIVQKKTGDRPKARPNVKVTALIAPVVTKAAVEAKGSILNDTKLSGKRLGAVVVAEIVAGTPVVLVANGSTDVATWTNLKTGVNVVPA